MAASDNARMRELEHIVHLLINEHEAVGDFLDNGIYDATTKQAVHVRSAHEGAKSAREWMRDHPPKVSDA